MTNSKIAREKKSQASIVNTIPHTLGMDLRQQAIPWRQIRCVLFVVKNSAMKPSKLQRHLTTKHPTLKDKTEEFFERKKRELDAQRQVLISSTSVNVAATKASYLVAHRIAKAKKNFTIGEELILPAAKDICRELLGEKAASKLEHVPLSDNTVARRIDDMAEDIEGQLLGRLKASPWYAIQVDESTDVENKAIMLVYVRYVDQDEVQEDLLCCLSLPSTTTGTELFQVLNEYVAGRLEWKFCVGVCTEGAAAMTGRLSGFTARVKEVAPECEATHCMIHREMLARSLIMLYVSSTTLKLMH